MGWLLAALLVHVGITSVARLGCPSHPGSPSSGHRHLRGIANPIPRARTGGSATREYAPVHSRRQ